MANSYTKIYIHFVFCTKYREPLIRPEFELRIWKYIGGIARSNNMNALRVGGVADHIHALISIPSTITIAKAIQLIKGGSSKWINDHFFEHRSFRWQKGYGAFSVSESGVPSVIRYIANQKKHHKTKTFKREYRALLEKYNVDYDERYVFD